MRAACGFARATGHRAVIGSLADIADLVAGIRGTNVEPAAVAVTR